MYKYSKDLLVLKCCLYINKKREL